MKKLIFKKASNIIIFTALVMLNLWCTRPDPTECVLIGGDQWGGGAPQSNRLNTWCVGVTFSLCNLI